MWYQPDVVSIGDQRCAEELQERVMRDNSVRRRNCEMYRQFASCNGMQPTDDATFFAMAGALLNTRRVNKHGVAKKYKCSTIVKMLKDIRWGIHRRFRSVTPNDVIRLIELDAAREPTRVAPEVGVFELFRRLRILQCLKLRVRAFMMALTGLRNADWNELNALHVDDASVSCRVTVAKNRRSKRHRAALSVEHAWSFWWLLPSEVKRACRQYVPQVIGTSTLDRRLQEIGLSSYSMRRCYVQQVIARFTDARGVIDWEAVKQKTLHFERATIEAFYLKADAGWRPRFVRPQSLEEEGDARRADA